MPERSEFVARFLALPRYDGISANARLTYALRFAREVEFLLSQLQTEREEKERLWKALAKLVGYVAALMDEPESLVAQQLVVEAQREASSAVVGVTNQDRAQHGPTEKGLPSVERERG